MLHKFRFLVVAFALMFTTAMHAQITTSSMNGRVTDQEGPIAGATVVAIHAPSGTSYGTITNADGRFMLTGMRVGGPYRVEV
ncbi:MAG: carboxypeptidase-like regulatory domain-containing protein, partial [Bacteroidales bacterium]|nr:carboxypeptidase-like regulatory domain-containing protein [Bacteroidales bacterium]